VAVLPLALAAAGARLLAAAIGVGVGVPADDLGGRAPARKQPRHLVHRLGDVGEEALQARAQVVEPGLAVWCGGEAVLRAAAVAGEAHVAVAAVGGRRVRVLGASRSGLLGQQRSELPAKIAVEVLPAIDLAAAEPPLKPMRGCALVTGRMQDALAELAGARAFLVIG
jgi:hypothetical protein